MLMTQDNVLVVGSGPSGLFAASELARHGIKVRLVEREIRRHRQARATAVQPGTLEIMESVGLLSPFLETAEHVRCTRLYKADLSELRTATFAGVDCRCEFLCSLPQYETEQILETHLVSLGGAVERGITVTKLDLDTDGVHAELMHADGRAETVHFGIVIGAGGAHSVTRESMDQSLGGATYEGHFLVADIAMQTTLPRDETSFVFGPDGLLLLAPLPGGRWLSFQDLEETVETVTADEVVARIEVRLGGRWRPTDVTWFAPFRMHRRIVSRLTDGKRFLIGDAAHLSSPFGGEGLNSGLHDAYDLAWKLALVLRGQARSSLLDGYAVERTIADRHVLEVSDQVHRAVTDIADTVRQGREVPAENVDPVAAALQRNSRAMLDVDYTGSPLVADYAENGSGLAEPHPGQRYPDWTRFGGTAHHLLVFGSATDGEELAALGRRWEKCVEISHNPDVRRERAGLRTDGMILIRPDGHIGFRFPAAGPAAIAALDRHLSSYLIPDPAVAPFETTK
jgi:6-methylpretetramide 4-monooxygenase / 4-hydroxy-6-methylpretetramide 12a-monooxygenase